MALYDELREVIRILETNRIDYAVCGGIALAIHGVPRFTRDIDLLVRGEDAERILELVRESGYDVPGGRLRFGAGKANEQIVHRVSKILDGELLVLDLIVVNERLSDVWSSRESFEWHGDRVQVVTREGLAFMKRVAGRAQDLADLERLEHDHESPDAEDGDVD